MRDIQLVLERWGGWAAEGKSKVGYPSTAAGFSGLFPESERVRLSCCDDDGIAIDAAIGKLISVGRKDEFDLIDKHYIRDISKSAIAREMKCSEGKIRQKLMIAETFIDACLIMANVTLEMDEWCKKTSFGS